LSLWPAPSNDLLRAIVKSRAGPFKQAAPLSNFAYKTLGGNNQNQCDQIGRFFNLLGYF